MTLTPQQLEDLTARVQYRISRMIPVQLRPWVIFEGHRHLLPRPW